MPATGPQSIMAGAIMNDTAEKEYVDLKRSIYREYSRSYDADRQRFVSGKSLSERIDWALEPFQSGHRLLDLGCGSGELLVRASALVKGKATPVGLDLTLEMMALSRDRVSPEDVSLVESNVLDGLPFQDRSFQLITSLNLFQELPSFALPALLEDIQRVLKPNGALRAVIPCMAEDNRASRAFKSLARELGSMEFLYVEDLRQLLIEAPYLGRKEFHFRPSPAASAAAKGTTRFKFFTQLQDRVKEQGLDPSQVKQGVLFFAAAREAA